jgi:porin
MIVVKIVCDKLYVVQKGEWSMAGLKTEAVNINMPVAAAFVLHLSVVGWAVQKINTKDSSDVIRTTEKRAGNLAQLNNKSDVSGIDLDLSLTNIYQQNVQGGISTHSRAGRFSGSYDLELSADMHKLLGLEGASLFIHTEGGWPKVSGIDEVSVGSAFGVNGDAFWDQAVVVSELWYEQSMFDDTFLFRIGKMDLITGGFERRGYPLAFDRSASANNETSQFLNSALVNNPTIPFPVYALGVAGFYNPIDWWYAAASVLDAQNDPRETGFRTTFYGEDYFFYIFETGITPLFNSENGLLQSAYRAGLWYDPQPKAHANSSKNYRDDLGFYLSCDQMLIKENAEAEDCQGLGVFLRYGYANSNRNDITNFWSAGFQYQGLLEGRDDDVIGAGFAQGFFSDNAVITYTQDYESALELYYNSKITPWWYVSPSMQYIANPSGARDAGDAVVLGIRVQMRF